MNTKPVSFLTLFNGLVQYTVPRWQRRYRWTASHVQRLVDDLIAVESAANPKATHYGGTLLTYPVQDKEDSGGMMFLRQVVDGQQRLTTVSILLACIAEALGSSHPSASIIEENFLRNNLSGDRWRYKLKLQKDDDEAYRAGIEGKVAGAGTVAHAWRIARRLVRKEGAENLMKGLRRLRVVWIDLAPSDDSQQIFESLNATGLPLTESEKLKNWLLMGLPESKIRELDEGPWRMMEEALQVNEFPRTVDVYMRDLLRWKTGKTKGLNVSYDNLRRWAVHLGKADNRESLCRELADISIDYGMLLPGGDPHCDRKVEKHLRHLRAIGLDTHRPLTLRLVHEARIAQQGSLARSSLAGVVKLISTWITRTWLADRSVPGMNKAIATLAFGAGPQEGENPVEFWKTRIERHMGSRVEVPSDDAVANGIATRNAYSGSAGSVAKAVLCALMENEQKAFPERELLNLEHIMPQKMTSKWTNYLGDDARKIHKQYCHRLANLTLVEKFHCNPKLGNKIWQEKRRILKSACCHGIAENDRIASELNWNPKSMDARTKRLVRQALTLWSWKDLANVGLRPRGRGVLAWRFEGAGDWHEERSIAAALVNVAEELISVNPKNVDLLCGDLRTQDLQMATEVPARNGYKVLPSYQEFTIFTGMESSKLIENIYRLCRKCGIAVEVEVFAKSFWSALKHETGGFPGQSDDLLSKRQRTSVANSFGDVICMTLTNEWVGVYIRAGGPKSEERVLRMIKGSRLIRDKIFDQDVESTKLDEHNANQGRTATISRDWDPVAREEWKEIAWWICDHIALVEEVVGKLETSID